MNPENPPTQPTSSTSPMDPSNQAGIPTTQPPTSQEPTPTRKFPKKIVAIVIAIILFTAIASGGYIFMNQQSKNSKQSKPVIVKKQLSPTPITLDSTTGWQTFSSIDFSFKYPERYKMATSNSIEVSWGEKDIPNDTIIPDQMNLFQSSVAYPPPGPDTDENFREITYHKDISLNGVAAQSYSVSCGTDCHYHEVQFTQNGTYNLLRFNTAGGGLDQTFDTILSTFEFSDQSKKVDTTNWKTFTNTQYGFSLKVPPYMKHEIRATGTYTSPDGSIFPMAEDFFYQGEVTICCGYEGPNLIIEVITDKTGKVIIKDKLDPSPDDKVSSIKVAGIIVEKRSGLAGVRFAVKHNDSIYAFTMYGAQAYDSNDLYAIISTFKFLDE